MLIVVADPGDHPGGLGRLLHLLRLLDADRQGLLAVHRLAGLQGGHGHGEVQVVGRGDRHQVDPGVVDQPLPVVVGPGKTPGRGAVFGALAVGIGQRRQVQAHRQFEYRADITKRQCMGPPHETGADQAYSQFTHSRPLAELLF